MSKKTGTLNSEAQPITVGNGLLVVWGLRTRTLKGLRCAADTSRSRRRPDQRRTSKRPTIEGPLSVRNSPIPTAIFFRLFLYSVLWLIYWSPISAQRLPYQRSYQWQEQWHLNFYPIPEIAACDSLSKPQRWHCAFDYVKARVQLRLSTAPALPDSLSGAVLLSWQLQNSQATGLRVEQSLHPFADRESLWALRTVLKRLKWVFPIEGLSPHAIRYYLRVVW